MKSILLLLLPSAVAVAERAPAQHPMGFTAGWGQDGTTLAHNPQSNLYTEGDFLTRIDHDDYRLWGLDPTVDASYGTFCLSGIEFVLEDPILATAETPAYVTGWSEDPLNPNHPDVPGYNPIGGGSNFLFAGPVPANSSTATLFTFTFPAPIPCVSTGQDIFLGVNIGPNASAGGLGEGLLVHGVNDQNLPLGTPVLFDNPGPAGASIGAGSYVCIVPTTNQEPDGGAAAHVGYLAQNRIEVYLTNAAGGVCTTVTNQASYPVSNLANGDGTPNFLSGLHPDASSLPLNAGRNGPPPGGWTGDRLGFIYTDGRLEQDDLVAILVAFQESAPPLPLDSLVGLGPAPTGQVLVHISNNATVAIGLAQPIVDPDFAYSRFSATFDFPPAARDLLQVIHPTLRWQGIGVDLSTGNFHATGLVRQHF